MNFNLRCFRDASSAAGCSSVSNVWGGRVTGQCIYQQPPRLLQLYALRHNWHPASASPVGAKCGGEAGNWHTTQRAHHTGVEVTPLVVSTPAYHVQGRHRCAQMSKRPCSIAPVQRPTVCWSAPDRHALCQCGPTGSSEVANCNRWPVFQHRWTTSLEHSACFCSWHKLVLALQETPENVSLCLTDTAPVALNWRL